MNIIYIRDIFSFKYYIEGGRIIGKIRFFCSVLIITILIAPILFASGCFQKVSEEKNKVENIRENITEKKENLSDIRENLTEKKENLTEIKENITSKKENLTNKTEEVKENLTETKENLTSKKENLTNII